jgi:hypothetical protein
VCGGVEVGERLREWVGEASTLGVRLVPPDRKSNCDPRTPEWFINAPILLPVKTRA